MLMSNCWC